MPERNGQRKTRNQLPKRKPELGYYYIVTDTEETEKNFLLGLQNSMPEYLQRKLIIKVVENVDTEKLVETILEDCSKQSQYCEPWIVFDRDKVENFNGIINDAIKNRVHVAWSNPCIEIFFYPYFGAMPTYYDSTVCCKKFAQEFQKITKQKYDKNDKRIYLKLCRFGDEKKAIDIAKRKFKEHNRNGNKKPKEMCPCTTLHTLVEEITNKIKENSQGEH